jgi:hypothetical protein
LRYSPPIPMFSSTNFIDFVTFAHEP